MSSYVAPFVTVVGWKVIWFNRTLIIVAYVWNLSWFLLCVLLEENVEVDAWVEKFSDGKWRNYAQELMGLKPHELDALEKGDPWDFLTFTLILSEIV